MGKNGDGRGRKDCRTTNFPLLRVSRGVKFCSPSHVQFSTTSLNSGRLLFAPAVFYKKKEKCDESRLFVTNDREIKKVFLFFIISFLSSSNICVVLLNTKFV